MIPLAAETMSTGVTGGWGYVIAAYTLTWVFLIGYAVSLWIRWPRGGGEP